ncbi:MAG: hypothetical protein CBC47_08605 [Alphaproteobacteria bacterium TMED87]|nr:hypothetical protein [Rhodospirillaceae bacterium]OUV07794.1 MAG: hypothetical protein CBC47_08605 [Alphaproteobacteria bacterium TMED87]
MRLTNKSTIMNKNTISRRTILLFSKFIFFLGIFGTKDTLGKNHLGKNNMGNNLSLKLKKGYGDGSNGQIHYRYVDSNKKDKLPLVCLHPSPISSIVYDNWLLEMGKDRSAIAPDTPGYGGSYTPNEPPKIEDLADSMIAFFDYLGLDQVDIMGYHTGSLTSADLALRYPDRIRKIIMISAPIFNEKIINEYSKRIYNPAPSFVDILDQTSKNIKEKGKDMFRDVPTDDRYADFSIERIRHYRTSNWGFRAAFAYNLKETLPKIEQPILILNPEDDLWELTPQAKPFLNNGHIHDLPGWTHGHLDAYTQEMAVIVRDFLDN